MRIYQNMREAMNEIKRDLAEMGVVVRPHTMQNKDVRGNSDYDTFETQNYCYCILDMGDKDRLVPHLEWCKAEHAERVDPNYMNPGKAWELRADVWKEFLRPIKDMIDAPEYKDDGRFWDHVPPNVEDDYMVFEYTYNERLQWQIAGIVEELKVNPDTRQAIIQVHNREVDASRMRKFRIPCSMSYQFMIRGGKLDVIYYLRSSDYNTHLAHDLWLCDELRNHIAKEIGVPPGILFCNEGSLHVYKNYGGKEEHIF